MKIIKNVSLYLAMCFSIIMIWILLDPVKASQYNLRDYDLAIVLFSAISFFSKWASLDSLDRINSEKNYMRVDEHMNAKQSADIAFIISSVLLITSVIWKYA